MYLSKRKNVVDLLVPVIEAKMSNRRAKKSKFANIETFA